MNYDETLSYLFDQLPMFQRVGAAAYRKDLRNTLALARMCDHPEDGFKCVHIAGTNGKGSTAHGLASVFQSCGYKTGLMTSPHYKDFRERTKVNGAMIPKDYVTDWIERYRSHFEHLEPSFFELTVIMGFCYFRDKQVDIAIIETGMGGRLDSTNIVTPELSVITHIGFDHTAFLGETLEQIALEKAGIIKQKIPVVLASSNEALVDVFTSVAASRQSELLFTNVPTKHIATDLEGDYQQENMATVLEACRVMQDMNWELPDEKIAHGLGHVAEQTGFMGRWQLVGTRPRIIADAAHNPDGISTLLRNIEKENFKNLHVVIGMVSDKDVDAVLSLLPVGATYYFCQAKVIRALSCDLLARQGMRLGLVGECYGSVTAALSAAKEASVKEDLIFVTGSVFVVAEVI